MDTVSISCMQGLSNSDSTIPQIKVPFYQGEDFSFWKIPGGKTSSRHVFLFVSLPKMLIVGPSSRTRISLV